MDWRWFDRGLRRRSTRIFVPPCWRGGRSGWPQTGGLSRWALPWIVWVFYVQHQFEVVYWERGEDWDYTAAAMQGSSFYKLPGILQWFSGNIGFHHLSSRIPNCKLERCHRSHPMFRDVKPITLLSSLKSLKLRLWDEKLKKLVGYRHIKDMRRERKRSPHP